MTRAGARRTTGRILALLVLAAALAACRAKPLTVEKSGWAHAIADRYGARSWLSARTRFLRYDVVVRRDGKEPVRLRELIDRGTGDYRFEADASGFGELVKFEGLPPGRLVALGNRELRIGNVWIEGERQPPGVVRAVRERLDYDSWWLSFPLDLGGPDLHVEDLGAAVGGQSPSLRHLLIRFPEGFDDVYHLYVDPDSLTIHRTRIAFPDGVVEVADWYDAVRLNGVKLHLERRLGDRTLRFENVALTSSVRRDTLRDPDTFMHDAR